MGCTVGGNEGEVVEGKVEGGLVGDGILQNGKPRASTLPLLALVKPTIGRRLRVYGFGIRYSKGKFVITSSTSVEED